MAKKRKSEGLLRPGAASGVAPHFGGLATHAIVAAHELGVMAKLADGPAGIESLARSTGADRRALRMLLDALVALGQIERSDGKYRLGRWTLEALGLPGVDADSYFADGLAHTRRLAADWSRLTDVVRTGRPIISVGDADAGPKFFPQLARQLFAGNYPNGRELVQALPARFRKGPVDVLDVACGSAAWSIPFAEANPQCRVTALDFGTVLEVARHFARACGVEGQMTFTPGDLRRKRLGTERYDAAILGHICHSEGARGTRRLFAKVHKALRPGGVMLVAEIITDERRTGEGTGPMPLIFALNMLLHTADGGTFTYGEYRGWAREAGFTRSSLIALPGGSPIMMFRKARSA